MIIYLVTNNINGKQYVGKTTRNVKIRFKEHCRSTKGILCKAIKKYGRKNFTVIEIDNATNMEELNKKEVFWIEEFNTLKNGYNMAFGGEGGHTHTEESRKRISNSLRGKILSKKHKDKISKANKGKKKPLGFGETSSKRQKGIPKKISSVKKQAESLKKWYTNEINYIQNSINKMNGYVFEVYTKEGQYINTYKSLYLMKKEIEIKSDSKVYDVIKGIRNHYKGLVFKKVKGDN